MSVDNLNADRKIVEKDASAFSQIREILESLAIALFLAFLFKTFEAEAFVIPTGSMAPTLMGRHKDVVCQECGYRFQTSASEEIDSANNRRTGLRVVAGVCPQCSFTQYFGDDQPSLKNDRIAPSFTGDRILVSKMTFDQRPLARWDVSVFRAPGDPKVNFIKRIVGLPNENLRVQYGDLFVQKFDSTTEQFQDKINEVSSDTNTWAPDVDLNQVNGLNNRTNLEKNLTLGNDKFEIVRKDYKYLKQILQVVYDYDYKVDRLVKAGWPERWTDDLSNTASGKSAWVAFDNKGKRGFRFSGNPVDSSDGPSEFSLGSTADVSPVCEEDNNYYWLRYRHIVPTSEDWYYLTQGRIPPQVAASGVIENNPRLIDDFSAYNAGISRRQASREVSDNSGARIVKMVDEWDRSNYDEFSQLSKKYIDSEGKTQVFCMKSPDGLGCNWVGDLALSFNLTVEKIESDSGSIAFDLVKGGTVFRCVISPVEKTVSLSIPSIPSFLTKTTQYKFSCDKSYNVVFLNVDEEMRVVINDEELSFDGRYDDLTISEHGKVALLPRNRDPNARDLAPAAIGIHGITARIENLKLLRDVYYIAAGRMLEDWDDSSLNDFNTARCDRLTSGPSVFLSSEKDSARFMSTPALWSGYGNTKSALLTQREGQYVAFGDNSGFSLDSRLWVDNNVPHYVDRQYLIGKAFYVYWPHGWPLPIVKSPFWPNFAKMRHID